MADLLHAVTNFQSDADPDLNMKQNGLSVYPQLPFIIHRILSTEL